MLSPLWERMATSSQKVLWGPRSWIYAWTSPEVGRGVGMHPQWVRRTRSPRLLSKVVT